MTLKNTSIPCASQIFFSHKICIVCCKFPKQDFFAKLNKNEEETDTKNCIVYCVQNLLHSNMRFLSSTGSSNYPVPYIYSWRGDDITVIMLNAIVKLILCKPDSCLTQVHLLQNISLIMNIVPGL